MAARTAVTASPPRPGAATSPCRTTHPSKPEAALPATEQVQARPHRHDCHCTAEQRRLREDPERLRGRRAITCTWPLHAHGLENSLVHRCFTLKSVDATGHCILPGGRKWMGWGRSHTPLGGLVSSPECKWYFLNSFPASQRECLPGAPSDLQFLFQNAKQENSIFRNPPKRNQLAAAA